MRERERELGTGVGMVCFMNFEEKFWGSLVLRAKALEPVWVRTRFVLRFAFPKS